MVGPGIIDFDQVFPAKPWACQASVTGRRARQRRTGGGSQINAAFISVIGYYMTANIQ
jgi:hypothetical protein